ncbi:CBD9-like protein [Glarea lozoyensis ATCC 20868]|uniref:CBD9-like protein n=1 Tax=Glarea lozoyensis (strain ATCC 20868 / MF5171) TaxID=1116229 RepID=S3CTM8_GLAL2|nr:CBD9-like protein [Glarea lozoyensis ATCC 20868]EPE28379.1 CBD9-like protein [Glarea lozoyensis ATCC 20868]
MLFKAILSLALALGVSAQGSQVQYTEKQSGITVTAYSNANFLFGVALPTTPSTDFIGVMIGKGTGWAAVSLGGPMTQNALLLATWPNAKAVLSSFRKTTSYASPAVAKGAWTLYPIANGTYTNTTHWVSTFLCKACLSTDGSTFDASAASDTLGWAFNTAAPTTKSSVTTTFTKHGSQGSYSADLKSAKTAKYATWAAYASNTTSTAFVKKEFEA